MDHQKLSKALSKNDGFSSLFSLLSLLNVRLEQRGDSTGDASDGTESKDTPKEIDTSLAIDQLLELIEKFSKITGTSTSESSAPSRPSLSIFKLISRNLVLSFHAFPTRVYDVTNKLLGGLDPSNPNQFKVNTLILIDLFQSFPTSLGSLNPFAINLIYKYLKKSPLGDANIVYLLAVICENATKLDIDDKFQQKLLKIAQKNIMVELAKSDSTGTETSSSEVDGTTILIKKNYLVLLKNLLILSVSTHYETLLSLSSSSSSGSSKLKPDALMQQQNTYQLSILTNYEKVLNYGLTNYEKEVRLCTVEVLANLLINFVPTGKFNAIEYLISQQYRFPALANYDPQFTREIDPNDLSSLDEISAKKPSNLIATHDSSSAINTNINLLLHQSSIVEALILYIQLEQVQNLDYLSSNLIQIMDTILSKFGDLNTTSNHIQNQQWSKVLKQWEVLINWMIKECGGNCHDMLMNYVYEKFHERPQNDVSVLENARSAKIKRRESGIFGGFKGKSSKDKEKELILNVINPYKNSYQCFFLLRIVDQLIPLGVSGVSEEKEKEKDGEKEKDAQEAAASASSAAGSDIDSINTVSHSTSFIREILFKLIINNVSYIRTYSLNTLLVYSRNHPVEVNQLILKTFKLINNEAKQNEAHKNASTSGIENTSQSPSIRLIHFSLTLSALIKNASYTSLQTSTIIKILSFCTQNLKQSASAASKTSDSYIKSSCWIVLTALITMYNDSEFVKLNSSQFLVFWKSLLTSQYLGGSEIEEVLNNLRVRNFSLCCLLNYLSTAELTPETLKQFQLLLAKSYNYITYIENMFETVGHVTTFNSQYCNDISYNVNLLNNIQYNSDQAAYIGHERTMISLILYNKKILLQSYKKIASYLKNDMNSNMVIYLLRLFSDSKIFCRGSGGDLGKEGRSSKSKKGVVGVNDFDSDRWVVFEEENYNFGISSLHSYHWDGKDENNEILYVDPFEPNSINKSTSWSDFFDQLAFSNTVDSPVFDPNCFLVKSLNASQLTTSLVDLSIELFQIVFPFLPLKIQMSLLEQMRNSLTNKSIDPFRLKAISYNISIVLNSLATRKGAATLDKQIVNTLWEILSLVEGNKEIITLNSESVGELSKASPAVRISKCIDEIVQTLQPIKRGEAILKLAYIYKSSLQGFNEIYDVIKQLLNDPNPIVYHYTLESCCIIFETASSSSSAQTVFNTHLEPLLEKIYSNYLLDDSFGYNIPSNQLVNSKFKFTSIGSTSRLLKLIITSLGPNLRESSELAVRTKIRNMIISLSIGIGCGNNLDSFEVSKELLLMFQELIIFDPTLIEGELSFITKYLDLIISKNLKLGLCPTSPTSTNVDSLFPFNSSFELYKLAFSCYSELIKILGPEKVLNKDLVSLMWISMNLKPCEELKEMIRFWMQITVEQGNWFGTLSGIFKLSSKKLVQQFMDINYQQKLLPLQQRQKKKAAASATSSGSGPSAGGAEQPTLFNDEESQTIVNTEASSSLKNEPITWEFKLFIFELLNHLLLSASRSATLKQQLISRIQDIVNISFLGSTSPISNIRKQGINLLEKCLSLFGDIPDPLYPTVSILEQQQAQIISALMPCFSSECDADLLIETINISSKFINLPRIKFYSKQRILKTLIDLLEELSSNKFLRFDYLENLSEFNKKSIQLSILNCWAILRIDNDHQKDAFTVKDENEDEDEKEEHELFQTLHKYSKLLISLWIVVLREFSTLKYNEPNSIELSIYSNYWVNFISVLSLEMADSKSYVHEALGSDNEEGDSFFFILFSQCIETLVKSGGSDNSSLSDVLNTITRLVKSSPALVNHYIFNDEIFGELIDLFDRLILIDEDPEVQCQLIEILSTIFNAQKENIVESDSFDKLFEVIRVTMLPLFNILPILRTDYDPSNLEMQFILKHCDSGPNLIVLKKCFASVVEMMSEFPHLVKIDLYSCLLFIFSKIYEYRNSLLISTILPHVKLVLSELDADEEVDLITPFSQLIQGYYSISSDNINSVLTSVVLISNGRVSLSDENSEELGNVLIKMLEKGSDNASLAIHCIKSLIQYSTTNAVVKYLIKKLIQLLVNDNEESKVIDPKIAMEILFIFSKNFRSGDKDGDDTDKAFVQLYSVIIPLLLQSELSSIYVHEKLMNLARQNANGFKVVVNRILTAKQRSEIEALVKGPSGGSSQTESDQDQAGIQLKTFGQ